MTQPPNQYNGPGQQFPGAGVPGGQFPPQQQPPQQYQQPQQPPQQYQQPQQPAQDLGSLGDLLQQKKTTGAFSQYTPFGTTVAGEVVETELVHHTDYETGELEFWPDGNPKVKVKIVIQTNDRDPSDPNDDGKRAVWVKYWGDQRTALLEAVKAAGDTDIRQGGYFAATLAGDKPNDKNPKLKPIKIYEYQYQKPQTPAGLASLPQPSQQQAPPAQPAAPRYDQGGQLPAGHTPMVNNTGAAIPVTPMAQQAPPQQAAPMDPWTGQQAPPQQAPPVGDAPAAALQQQQQAAAVQQPAAPAEDETTRQVRQFIGIGLTDEQIMAALPVTAEQIAALRQ